MSEEINKLQDGEVTVVSATVLGQKRAEYARLKDKGIAEDRITERQQEDALQFGLTLDNYQSQLDSLRARGSGEKLEILRAEHIDKLKGEFLTFVANSNAVIDIDWKTVKFSRKSFNALRNFLLTFSADTKQFVKSLQDSEFTTKRGKQCWSVMLHAPIFNFITDVPTDTELFAPLCGGWSDKGRQYDQYGVRQQPSGAATFYRPISFETPIMIVEFDTVPPAEILAEGDKPAVWGENGSASEQPADDTEQPNPEG